MEDRKACRVPVICFYPPSSILNPLSHASYPGPRGVTAQTRLEMGNEGLRDINTLGPKTCSAKTRSDIEGSTVEGGGFMQFFKHLFRFKHHGLPPSPDVSQFSLATPLMFDLQPRDGLGIELHLQPMSGRRSAACRIFDAAVR